MAASSSSSAFYGGKEGSDAMKINYNPYSHQQPLQPPLQPPPPQQQHSSAVPPPPPPLSSSAPPSNPQNKKKRSLPGTPNPDAEVIALSPKTLMATNRFICEVCNKGFQREQNLQLHRRGHNLPWKLKQKTNKDQVKKKVYLCPETTCVHHDPARALGDLTGIKKHYSRKHGEKKFKCEKCSKRYAVQSDWKAHSKTCGTREYRCDCGTLFSRRDSFITHRAFCDALAQETARHPTNISTLGSHLFGPSSALGGVTTTNNNMGLGVGLSHQLPHHLPPSFSDQMTSDILRLGGGGRGVGSGQFDHLLGGSPFRQQSNMHQQNPGSFYLSDQSGGPNHFGNSNGSNTNTNDQDSQSQNASGGIFSNKLFPGQLPDLGFFSNNTNNSDQNTNTITTTSSTGGGLFSPTGSNSLFGGPQGGSLSSLYTTGSTLQGSSPHMSATALLQKAAQMGSSTSNNNASASALLKGLEAKPSAPPQSGPAPPPTSIGGGAYGGLFGENEQNNLHELLIRDNIMNTSFFGGDHHQTGGSGDHHNSNYGGFNPNKTGLGVGSSDRLTRDFLGVGEIVRSMSGGGFNANSQSMNNSAANNNNNSANTNTNVNNSVPSNTQAFGGNGNNF
ncbi:protein indeterminate-domain 5, chloroplastic isoform X2 [Amaranthus tricolor]|uniref:protein indeterminate-domain 5, chloroplastic isoform X2 n=1 Tax=Amaranthus tricolor TaxID=29722 RepID=UPI00258DF33C|nr:protein indeterminate-domain 5, chloroplastic isoform X2 [Amaranthus tricolor]